MNIKNLGDLKSAQCFVCVTSMIPFLTELSHETKSGTFMIIVNDLPTTKVASAKDYGDSLVLSTTTF